MNASGDLPSIYVIAGVNGAGKSSVVGAHVVASGAEYYNPDEATREILAANPGTTLEVANEVAWNQGRRLLERAISERREFAFETTLGGNTITTLLEKAAHAGLAIRVWYVGLKDVELHIKRVKERVRRGGHDIPEQKIRERYERSRKNLVRLLPCLTELRVFDNSAERDPAKGVAPQPVPLLHLVNGKIRHAVPRKDVPEWADDIFRAAKKLETDRRE